MSDEEKAEEVEELGFEEAMERLEKTVQKLEQGELSLDESMNCFQEGIKLSRRCREILAQAEYRVEYLLKEEGLEQERQEETGTEEDEQE